MERLFSISFLALILGIAFYLAYAVYYLFPEPTPFSANVKNEAGECTLLLPSNPDDLIRVEDKAWEMIKDSNDLADLKGFLNCFPNSALVTLVEREYDKLVMDQETLMELKINTYHLMMPIVYMLVSALLFFSLLVMLPGRLVFNLIDCSLGRPNDFRKTDQIDKN